MKKVLFKVFVLSYLPGSFFVLILPTENIIFIKNSNYLQQTRMFLQIVRLCPNSIFLSNSIFPKSPNSIFLSNSIYIEFGQNIELDTKNENSRISVIVL